MTDLSVNLNKIALLRNSRGRNYPSVVDFAGKFIDLGAQGITIHPRPDERHIKLKDTFELSEFIQTQQNIELNIEGYPNENFLKLIEEIRPDQCTLVPDAANQLTSDHGWDFEEHLAFVKTVIEKISSWGVRTAVFLDADLGQVELAAETGCQRIELYTESYAQSWGLSSQDTVLNNYRAAASKAQNLGLGVNAGHDLDLNNLPEFLTIPGILEVSIGHGLIVECVEFGMQYVIQRYLEACRG